MGAAALAGGAGIAGALINSGAVNATNASNTANIQQQEQFQENMSDTAYQRQAQDLQAAGLNRIMAINGGGASTPMGGAPQLMAPRPGDALSQGVSSALQGAATAAQLDKTQADIANVEAQTERTKVGTLNDTSSGKNIGLQGDAIKQGIAKSIVDQQAVRQGMTESSQRVSSAKTAQDINKLSVPGAEAQSKFDSSWLGKIKPYVDFLMGHGTSASSAYQGSRNAATGEMNATTNAMRGMAGAIP